MVRDGRVLGTLCVHGPTPGQLRPNQLAALASLADQAVALVEQSRDAREAGRQAALFRLIAEGSADVLSRHRMDGTLVWVSPSVRAVLGSSPEDVLGSDVVDRVHPDDAEGLRDAVRSVGATGAAASALVRRDSVDARASSGSALRLLMNFRQTESSTSTRQSTIVSRLKKA